MERYTAKPSTAPLPRGSFNIADYFKAHPGVTEYHYDNVLYRLELGVVGAYIYPINDTFEKTITIVDGAEILKDSIDISIPGMPSAKWNHRLCAVSLPQSLKVIGNGALEGCSRLTAIDLPEGLTTIGYHAFHQSGLRELKIPATVTKIDTGAFEECSALRKVTFSKMARGKFLKIGKLAFADCLSLGEVNFAEGLRVIGDEAFECTALKSVVCPSTLRAIGFAAFVGCRLLKSVKLNEGLKTIERHVFIDTAITNINQPSSIDSETMKAAFEK